VRPPADYRLAFRELGLSIGMHAVVKMKELIDKHRSAFDNISYLSGQLANMMRHAPLQREIEAFWSERPNRETEGWSAHRFINMVMLATSLLHEGI